MPNGHLSTPEGKSQKSSTEDFKIQDANDNISLQRQGFVTGRNSSHGSPTMLGRMAELECVIATVKSSLDNHASSYYSVASQIAELNARIGRLGLLEKPINIDSTYSRTNGCANNVQHNAANDTTDASSLPHFIAFPVSTVGNTDFALNSGTNSSAVQEVQSDKEQSDKEQSDSHYTRIQQMIDSLIKDADSALQSKPANNRFSVLSDDSVDVPVYDPMFAAEQLSSVSAEFGETPTLVSDAESALYSPAFSHEFPVASCSLPRPLSRSYKVSRQGQQQQSAHSYSPLPKFTIFTDPMEADAEFDSEVSASSVLGHRYRRKNRGHSYAKHRRNLSLRRDASGHCSDRQTNTAIRTHRRRSNTIDSLLSNSSETCVSPGDITSREFRHIQSPYVYKTGTHAFDSPYARSRAAFGLDGDKQNLSNGHAHDAGQFAFNFPLAAENTHEFPRLSFDSNQQDNQNFCSTGKQRTPPPIRHVPPLINRFRNSVSRVALQSASLVDGSVNDDIAAYKYCGVQCQFSPTLSPEGHEIDHTFLYEDKTGIAKRELHNQKLALSQPVSTYGKSPLTDTNNSSSHECVQKCDSNTKRLTGSNNHSQNQLLNLSSKTYMVGKCHNNSDASGGFPGILGIFSLIYWTLLFTLGALMLDSFLCQVAGKRVMGTVDRIAQTEGVGLPECTRKNSSDSSNSQGKGKERAGCANEANVNMVSAMGRLVRWYIEDPDEKPSSRLLHLRKAQASRGSFKHIG
ncbi:hypothetical protein GGI25_000904 [Coemansia spiralis]|uniref:Uncharacterized protein n=2 Tax=Coemansia TaxID=4863 RepID=A0A9W8GC39_9FUNG|nr:hypothetical protein EDC05_001729 [Coemansia umbellata]KAJ2623641.1 hypothetical protein GGI26_002279 [Coemansia sp. RSA 1358]KAJ2680311.1 hypothetical protein GGI25_000904 [Coemansia spiralis]